jgi:hypothetical protein
MVTAIQPTVNEQHWVAAADDKTPAERGRRRPLLRRGALVPASLPQGDGGVLLYGPPLENNVLVLVASISW